MYYITYYILMTLFVLVSLFMILLVLIQKGRGGGLSAAFSGSGGNTAFGSKTGDVLTWVTSVTFGIFVLIAIVMNIMVAHSATWGKKVVSSPKSEPITTTTQPAATQPVEAKPASTLPALPALPAIPEIPATLPN